MIRTIYKLYEEEQCFGDQDKHKTINKKLVMENKNMEHIMNWVNIEGNISKTYTIQKYIDYHL
jgi:hypothetical protein